VNLTLFPAGGDESPDATFAVDGYVTPSVLGHADAVRYYRRSQRKSLIAGANLAFGRFAATTAEHFPHPRRRHFITGTDGCRRSRSLNSGAQLIATQRHHTPFTFPDVHI